MLSLSPGGDKIFKNIALARPVPFRPVSNISSERGELTMFLGYIESIFSLRAGVLIMKDRRGIGCIKRELFFNPRMSATISVNLDSDVADRSRRRHDIRERERDKEKKNVFE